LCIERVERSWLGNRLQSWRKVGRERRTEERRAMHVFIDCGIPE
jgi:hypothetical protein